MDFSELSGNETLKKRLAVSFQKGTWSHCYLICGPQGSGKRTLAKIMAGALQCQVADAPCGHCSACRKIRAGIHPDVIVVDDAEKKTVSVELVRQLQADAFVHPNEGKRKIYVIPRAQDMTESAQNALLKIIEEPPSYAVFLLLTDNAEKLLPTVRSRSVELRLEAVQQQEELPQTELFVKAFSQGDRYELTHLLCSMEKMPREQVLRCFAQWKTCLTDGLSARAGMQGTAKAQTLGRSRTAQELAAAAAQLQKAMELTAANIGVGHICGWLAASL